MLYVKRFRAHIYVDLRAIQNKLLLLLLLLLSSVLCWTTTIIVIYLPSLSCGQ